MQGLFFPVSDVNPSRAVVSDLVARCQVFVVDAGAEVVSSILLAILVEVLHEARAGADPDRWVD